MANYSISQVAKRVREKYGRVPNERNLKKLAQSKSLDPSSLSSRQVISLIQALNLRRLPLSSEKEALAFSLLKRNQTVLPHERLSLGEIAKRVGHRSAPISSSMLKKVNAKVRSSIESKGKTATKFTASAKQHDKTLLSRLRNLLASNWNISFEDALKSLGVSKTQLQDNLPKYKTNFSAEVVRATKGAIEAFDARTGRKLSNAELATKLHISESKVKEYRKRRGRQSGVAVRVRQLNDESLAFLSAFSSPQTGSLSLNGISALTGASQLTLQNSLSQLKRKGLVWEVDYKGSNRYCISNKGISLMNGANGRAHDAPRRLSTFSLEKLNQIHDRLIDAKLLAGVDVPMVAVSTLNEMIKIKERERIKI